MFRQVAVAVAAQEQPTVPIQFLAVLLQRVVAQVAQATMQHILLVSMVVAVAGRHLRDGRLVLAQPIRALLVALVVRHSDQMNLEVAVAELRQLVPQEGQGLQVLVVQVQRQALLVHR